MAKIVSIETATKVCSIALHFDGKLVATQTYHLEKSHSSLLPVIIEEMLTRSETALTEIDAFAVSEGPGSYTGLRIGVTTAKGLAYALKKKLISVPTLLSMHRQIQPMFKEGYFCPMIDARRMEVYSILHEGEKEIWKPIPLIVEADSFSSFADKPIYLFGDGAEKTKEVLSQSNIKWLANIHPSAVQVGEIAEEKYQHSQFEDVAYFEPFYLKEFQTKPAKKLI